MAKNSVTKKNMKNHSLQTIFFFTVFFLIFGRFALAANLDFYLAKYKNIKISNAQLARLSGVDDLVMYFSGFDYTGTNVAVSANFVRALILAESNCVTDALSNKNARGLAQILYSTGKRAAANIARYNKEFLYIDNSRLGKLNEQDLNDPAINILLMCFLISKYNYKYDGQLDLVVSAWNAGEGSIKNGQPPEYPETLNLIGRVNGYYQNLVKITQGEGY